MTYNEFLQLPNSPKNIVFEVDQGFQIDPLDISWMVEEPGIWRYQYSWEEIPAGSSTYGYGSFGYLSYGGSVTVGPTRVPIQKMRSFLVNQEQYAEVFDMATLRITDKSFFWDGSIQTLYVNFQDNTSPNMYTSLIAGLTKGFATNESFFNGALYEGRLRSVPSINTSRDSLFYGLVSFEGGSADLINTDGYFDQFGDSDVYGAECRILFGSPLIDFSEYKTLYTGYIQDYQLTASSIRINFKDTRKLLSTSLPTNNYTKTAFPGIVDDNVGTPIPLIYGVVRKAPAVCTNELTGTTTFSFKVADTSFGKSISAITKVYVDNKSVAFSNTSLANATFDLASTVYAPGQEVTVDCTGYTDGAVIQNPVKIIRDLITTHTSLTYTSAFFNLIDWAAAEAAIEGRHVGVWIGEKSKLVDIIGNIASSVFGIFEVDGEGKFSFRFRDTTKTSVATIDIDSLIDPATVQLGSKEYINSTRVRYNVAWADDKKSSFFTDTSRQATLFSKFRSNVQKEFKTLLTTEANASWFSGEVLDAFGGIFPTYSIQTKLQFSEVKVGDNVDLQIDFGDTGEKQYVKCEVLSKQISFDKFSTQWSLRFLNTISSGANPMAIIHYKM